MDRRGFLKSTGTLLGASSLISTTVGHATSLEAAHSIGPRLILPLNRGWRYSRAPFTFDLNIPPFGHRLDYLTFGGIYREVSLRIVATSFIENIFVRPTDVLSGRPGLEADCFIQHLELSGVPLLLQAALLEADRPSARVSGIGAAGRCVYHE